MDDKTEILASHNWELLNDPIPDNFPIIVPVDAYLFTKSKKNDPYMCKRCYSLALCEVGEGPPQKSTEYVFCDARRCEEELSKSVIES
jgi:hypothetical protein